MEHIFSIFASLVTGNGIVFKPHNSAILPIALTVQIAREVLTEAGFDPDLVTMVATQTNVAVKR